MDSLTPKQEKYVNERIKGKSQRQAYKAAYPDDKSKDNVIDSNACRLEHNSKVINRLEYLRSLSAEHSIATRDDIIKELTIIASDIDKPDSIRLKAIDQLSKNLGLYNDNVNVNFAGSLLTGKDKAAALKDYIQSLKS